MMKVPSFLKVALRRRLLNVYFRRQVAQGRRRRNLVSITLTNFFCVLLKTFLDFEAVSKADSFKYGHWGLGETFIINMRHKLVFKTIHFQFSRSFYFNEKIHDLFVYFFN